MNSSDPAFPTHVNPSGMRKSWSGMTKREYFAALAMQSLAQATNGADETLCDDAVKLADKLIKALNTIEPT